MSRMTCLPLVLLLAAGGLLPAQGPSRPILAKAMGEELDRNLKELAIPGLKKPFFLACRLRDAQVLTVQASLGALVRSSLDRQRLPEAEVLVGDYQQNQGNFMDLSDYFGGMNRAEAPLDDQPGALRRAFWTLLDARYKKGAEQLEKKAAVLQQQKLPEELANLADLSKASARVTELPAPALALDRMLWENRAKALSAVLLRHPGLQRSSVTVSLQQVDELYQNSEGTRAAGPANLALVRAELSTQATDGRALRDEVTFVARRGEELPPQAAMEQAVEEAAATLVKLASAPAYSDSYSGPVLIEGAALADLVAARFFSPKQEGLLATRRPVFGNAQEASFFERQMGKSMEEKLEARVLHAAYHLKATPRLEAFQGQPLAGAFSLDAEGQVPQDLVLVEKGMLRNLLACRVPTPKVQATNGHLRSLLSPSGVSYTFATAVAPGVVSLEVDASACKADLKKELLQAAKESGLKHAYIVRRMAPAGGADGAGGPEEAQGLPLPLHLYRVTVADGKEELVRGAQLGGISVSALKHLLGASKGRRAHNLFLTPSPLQQGLGCPASFILPEGLLFEELELRKPRAMPNPKLPAVPSPLVEP